VHALRASSRGLPLASALVHHEPAAWETNAVDPFLTAGKAAVCALGEDRFRLVAPDAERKVAGLRPSVDRTSFPGTLAAAR
jgi:hypothetical protein